MVKLNKIYTRTGDDGTTALVSGPRRPKHDLRVEAYGTVDETNAFIGVARQYTAEGHPQIDGMLGRIQNDLFDLGADLATPPSTDANDGALRIVSGQVKRIESEIDELNAKLDPLTSFVLPGGSAAAAVLHVSRTVSRRAERLMTALSHEEGEIVGAPALQYINRLSDFLFVAARAVNDNGSNDVLWIPGKNR